jgi:ubiquinone/menaquinone biosynthesis C-methylase UbiE
MHDPIGRALMKWRIATVLPYLSGRVLDVGCGTNELLRAYQGEGIGIDVHPWDGVDLIVENSARIPFEDNSFDTVSCVAALNHIPNREEFLLEAYRLIRPGGALVITMIPPRISRVWHFLQSPWDSDQKERGIKPGEVYGISLQEMRSLLRAAGFLIAREKGFMLGINRIYVAQKPVS